MKATTIKIEGELLRELENSKPESVSLSAYIREILRADVRRRRLSQAAVSYREFLAANPEEQCLLREWDEADLATSPKPKGKRR